MNPLEVTVTKEVTLLTGQKINILKVLQVNNFYAIQKVVAQISGLGAVVLWEGASYIAIGQWTDTNVKERLQELYSN